MTLEQLRIFVAVAEREHVTKAARELKLTQSATSAAIAALEANYQVKLFDRVGRRIELTSAGRIFLSEARSVLARVAAAEASLADIHDLGRGSLRLAASQTIGNYWLPRLLHRYRRAYPGVTVHLTVGNTDEVRDKIVEGAADVGFIEGPIDAPALMITAIATDELALVASPAAADPLGRPVCGEDIRQMSWVLRERGSATRAIFENELLKQGIVLSSLDIMLELPSNEAVRAAVECGAGAAVLPKLVVDPSLRSGTLVQLDLTLPKRHFFAIRHKQRHISQAERRLHVIIGAFGEPPRETSAYS